MSEKCQKRTSQRAIKLVRFVPEADVPNPHLQFIEQQTRLGLRGSSVVNNGHLAKMADAWAGPW